MPPKRRDRAAAPGDGQTKRCAPPVPNAPIRRRRRNSCARRPPPAGRRARPRPGWRRQTRCEGGGLSRPPPTTLLTLAAHHCGRRKERSDKGKKHAQPEARLHAACVAYLRKHGMLPLGSAASGFRVGMKTAVVAMKDRGMEKGQPDLLVLERGANDEPGLAVEFKIDQNVLSPEQQRWFEMLRQRGWQCAEVHSTAEFHTTLSNYLGRSLPSFYAEFIVLE